MPGFQWIGTELSFTRAYGYVLVRVCHASVWLHCSTVVDGIRIDMTPRHRPCRSMRSAWSAWWFGRKLAEPEGAVGHLSRASICVSIHRLIGLLVQAQLRSCQGVRDFSCLLPICNWKM